LRDMEDAMQEVGSPKCVCRGLRDGIPQTTNRVQPPALDVRSVTDDGFLRCVGSAPVACPSYSSTLVSTRMKGQGSSEQQTLLRSAVLVGVVAAKSHVASVGRDNAAVDA
jgi:hypothetical protein